MMRGMFHARAIVGEMDESMAKQGRAHSAVCRFHPGLARINTASVCAATRLTTSSRPRQAPPSRQSSSGPRGA